ncbi:MAG: hypothetical protein PHF79_02670 [Candidatus Pacebacteria bacterium]|nr:hypothetical protein [Candidatus Paceibacterota bacterium]
MNKNTKNIIYIVAGVIVLGLIIYAIAVSSNRPKDFGQMSTSTGATTTQNYLTQNSYGTETTQLSQSHNLNQSNQIQSQPSNVIEGNAFDTSLVAQAINSAVITVPQTGVEVALNAGQADYTDSQIKGHVSVGAILNYAYTDDGSYDVFVEMLLTKENQAPVLHYVALFRLTGKSVKYTSAVLIGDRLPIQSVTPKHDRAVEFTGSNSTFETKNGYLLNVSYLDRKNAEPMTTPPTLQEVITLHVRSHILTF